uniref:DUF4326 protein n=1 Tax=Clandestinovirus TaxID=2831644 RepID=A0A8F8KNF1_9VIRU|nr:DUF4326 protein [Clandestinovirus]
MNTLTSFKERVAFIMDLDQKEIIERAKYLVLHPRDVPQLTGRHVKVNSGLFASSFTSTKFGNGSQRFEHYRNFLKEKLADPENISFVGNLLRLRGDILLCACSPNICHGHLLALVANFDRIDRLEEVARGELAETNQELDALIKRVKNEINPPPAHTLIPVNPNRPKLFRDHVHDDETASFNGVRFSFISWPTREISVKFDRVRGHNDEYENPATLADCKIMAHIIDYFWDRIVQTPGYMTPRTPMEIGGWYPDVNTTRMRTAEVDRNGVTRGGWMTGLIGHAYGFTWYCPPEVMNPPHKSASKTAVQSPDTQIPMFPPLPSIRPVSPVSDAQQTREKRLKRFDPTPVVEEPMSTSLNSILNSSVNKSTTSSINNTNVKPSMTVDEGEYKPTLNGVMNTSAKKVAESPVLTDLRDLLQPKRSPSPEKKKKDKKEKVDEFEKFWNKVEKRTENNESGEESEEEEDIPPLGRRPRPSRIAPLNFGDRFDTPKFLLDIKPEDLDQTDKFSEQIHAIEQQQTVAVSTSEEEEIIYENDDEYRDRDEETEDENEGQTPEYEVLRAVTGATMEAVQTTTTAPAMGDYLTRTYQDMGYPDDNEEGYDFEEMDQLENATDYLTHQ